MGQRRSKILDVEDVVSIRDFFDDLPDSRSSINQKHRLGDIIVICVCAVLAGADGPLAISVWAEAKREWLQRYLQPENGIPSRSTIARVLASLKPSTFQECFQAWLAAASSKFVTRGTVDHDSCIFWAIVARILVSFSRRTGPQLSFEPPGVTLAAVPVAEAAEAVRAVPVRTTARMSSRMIRPAGPEPVTCLRSTPTSRAKRRMAGPAARLPRSLPVGVEPAGMVADVTAAGWTVAAGAAGATTAGAGATGAGVTATGAGATGAGAGGFGAGGFGAGGVAGAAGAAAGAAAAAAASTRIKA